MTAPYNGPGMSRRWSLALGLSVLVHLALIGLPLGLGAWRPSGPVDIELTGLKLDEVKDLPLGGPAGGKGTAHAPRRAHHRAPAEGTLAAKADERERPGRATSSEDDTAPAPSNDLSSYGPKGSRLTILLRLDRLRGSDYVAPVDALLQRLPDRRDLLEGTGLDLFESFDALLIATPHPLDPSVTFLAARHRLDDAALRAALNRGAKATDRVIAWRTQAGRPVGERRPRRGLPPGAASRDDRLIVLAAPGLAIVTPPAYRALLMAPRAPAPVPDGGAAPDGADGGAPDGGAPGAAAWATMLDRIDAEEGLIPLDGVAMVSAVDIFKTSAHASGVPPVLYGMEVPSAVSAVIGLDDDGVFLDLDGQFPVEGQARHWEDEWPTIQHKLAANPIVLLTGFSPLVSHATLTRDGLSMRLHVSATHDEMQRLLALALRFLGG
jgi:hypothetical protein